MRNISFMLTKEQVRNRTKTVTRRMGWKHIKVGDVLRGVEKGMGLKPGEKIVPLCTIRVIDARPEPLNRMTADLDYGFDECRKEGFGDHATLQWPSEFVDFFCASHKGCTRDSEITRIEFEYLD